MSQDANQKTPSSDVRKTLDAMHNLLLEALRHREQEMVRYLAILGPALGGFVWLLHSAADNNGVFTVGTVGVILLLLLGAVYSLALGYNYRYLVLQLAKLQAALEIGDAMLLGWPRSSEDFLVRYKLRRRFARLTSPEIINVFYWAFLIGLFVITAKAWEHQPKIADSWPILVVGVMSLVLSGFVFPVRFGRKLRETCEEEPLTWDALAVVGVSRDIGGQEQ